LEKDLKLKRRQSGEIPHHSALLQKFSAYSPSIKLQGKEGGGFADGDGIGEKDSNGYSPRKPKKWRVTRLLGAAKKAMRNGQYSGSITEQRKPFLERK